jgi:hypothetical protein
MLTVNSSTRLKGGHVVAQWLRHYATGRKVVGLRPDEVNEIFSIYLILLTAMGLYQK